MSIGMSATTLLLFLPLTATACPAGWTPSPTSATWGPRCYLVPPERSTSLFRCVELCKAHGGAPACIGSAEENAFVTEKLAEADGLWLGLYQNETGLGPAKGWGRCVAGDAPSFTNWHEGQPDDFHGYQQDCAWVDAATGLWRALACDGSVRFDPRPWKIAKLSCLCAHGNASAAFAHDRKALEATSGYNERLLSRRTAVAFSATAFLAVLPTLLLLGRMGWRWLRRGADAEPGAGAQGVAASFAAVKRKLRAARASAAARRLRVSFAIGQAGFALFTITLTPVAMDMAGRSIEAAVGDWLWWLVPWTLGACLLTLALFPTDARAIRVVCATWFVAVFVGFGALNTVAALAGSRPAAHVASRGAEAALCFASAAALAPTLRCRGDRAMQPRPALRRLWIVIRLRLLGGCVFHSAFSIAIYVQGNSRVVDRWAVAAWSVADFLLAAIATPRNRGRLHRRLGRLGGRGTEAEEAEEAAAIAALVGGSAPDAALERAARLLRCLPASRLLAADLASSGLGVSTSATGLAAKTEPAAMGEVTAFLSHSWSDEEEAPGAKHALLSRWAKRRQEKTGKEPTLWLVRRLSSHSHYTLLPRITRAHARDEIIYAPRTAQDKACIDQSNIEQSLACLPVFLAGCQTLLVVAGPTYCSRLWCVMELFTFARSERP